MPLKSRRLYTREEKIFAKYIKEIDKHMRKDGWDLDLSLYSAMISGDILGYDVSTVLWTRLEPRHKVVFENGNLLIRKNKKVKRDKKVKRKTK